MGLSESALGRPGRESHFVWRPWRRLRARGLLFRADARRCKEILCRPSRARSGKSIAAEPGAHEHLHRVQTATAGEHATMAGSARTLGLAAQGLVAFGC